jgi:hypothetical protein
MSNLENILQTISYITEDWDFEVISSLALPA